MVTTNLASFHAVLAVKLALQMGYLSMDQARSLLPLEASDSNVSTPHGIPACLRDIRKNPPETPSLQVE